MIHRVVYEVTPKAGGWEVSRPIPQVLEDLRESRLEQIKKGDTPVVLEAGPRFVLHFVPQSSLASETEVDIRRLGDMPNLRPLSSSTHNSRFNADGFLVYNPEREGKSDGYLQVFRGGIVEAVSSRFFGEVEGRPRISGVRVEKEVLEVTPRLIQIMEELGIVGPFGVMMSLTGVRGFSMTSDPSRFWPDETPPIDRDVVLVPPVEVKDAADDLGATFRPGFDLIWQAAGFPSSRSYGADGKRTH
jgi:hypothetical protein